MPKEISKLDDTTFHMESHSFAKYAVVRAPFTNSNYLWPSQTKSSEMYLELCVVLLFKLTEWPPALQVFHKFMKYQHFYCENNVM